MASLLLTGCGSSSKYCTQERYQHGYTVVLPGIEGRSPLNYSIAKGLVRGGVPGAVEVYDWTAGSVLLFAVTLRAEARNRTQGRKIAQKIIRYQDRYPDQPVHIVGHSGGGGVAVYALEALPPTRRVTSAILLGPALAPDYDLRRALRRTEYGIWNFYSPHDKGWLGAGTTVFGTVDGEHTSAAGAVGFSVPWNLDKEGRQLYGSRLFQQPYVSKMADSGNSGGHTSWANSRFVAEWLAPIFHSQSEQETRYVSDERRRTK